MSIIHKVRGSYTCFVDIESLYDNKTGEKELWMPEDVGHVGGFEEKPEEYKGNIIRFFDEQLSA